MLAAGLLLTVSLIGVARAEEPLSLAWIRVVDLAKKCNGHKVWEQAYCIGYVVGVADVANNDPSGLRICVPKTITQGQMKLVVVEYIARHNDESEYAAFTSVRAALRDAFPRR
jgi:Ssp1 endopeptidase immunity protein Rap1a